MYKNIQSWTAYRIWGGSSYDKLYLWCNCDFPTVLQIDEFSGANKAQLEEKIKAHK